MVIHGHTFGVADPLPLNPNQKPTKYEQTRTRLNNDNKAKVREVMHSILSNPKSYVYTDVNIRGIQGRVYHCKDTNRVVGIHTEVEFAGQIMKPYFWTEIGNVICQNKTSILLNFLFDIPNLEVNSINK